MATADPSSVARDTGNDYIDSLIWGYKWVGGITYNVRSGGSLTDEDGDAISATGETWSDFETTQVKAALQSWANVANLSFTQQQDDSANLNFNKISGEAMLEITGQGNVEGFQAGPSGSAVDGYGCFNSDLLWSDALLQEGANTYATLIHEFGHGLGLAHPHDNGGDAEDGGFGDGSPQFDGVSTDEDLGTNELNQQIFTIMSYNVGWTGEPVNTYEYGQALTPMAFDIAAIQKIYGANTTYESGNSSYTLPSADGSGTGFQCIWDTGGTDVIGFSGSADATIDLREAPLTGANAGGYVSWAKGVSGGFTIANGVTIENANGAAGADTLVGNDVANSLSGASGADLLTGNGGGDLIYGNQGSDLVYGNGDADTLFGGQTGDTLYGGAADDVVYGNFGNDAVFGNNGADRLFGGQEEDTLRGGAGADVLYGNDDNDHLFGGAGDDVLYGGAGGDLFYFEAGTGNDTVADYDASGGDTLHLVGVTQASAADDGSGNAVVTLSDGGTVTVLNTGASDLLFLIA